MKENVVVLNLPDAFINSCAMHKDSPYIRKQASGNEDWRSPALARNGKLMERKR